MGIVFNKFFGLASQQKYQPRSFPARLKYVAVLLVFSKNGFPAASQNDLWNISISEAIKSQDNWFLRSSALPTPSGTSRADTTSTSSLLGDFGYEIGRQRFSVNAQVNKIQYANNTQLDNVASTDKVLWHWQLSKFFTGEISYIFRNYLGGFSNTAFLGQDMISESSPSVSGQFSWAPHWRLRGGVSLLDGTHSVQIRNFLNRQITSGNFGVDFTSNKKNSIGLNYSFSDTTLPNQQLIQATLVDNNNIQQNINASLLLHVLDKTNFTVNIGYTTKTYTHFNSRNFSGLTGQIAVGWQPTAKFACNFYLAQQLNSFIDETASYFISQRIGLSSGWKLSSKIRVFGDINLNKLDYAGDPGLLTGPVLRHDEIWTGQLGANYTPLQNTQISLSYTDSQRTSNRFGFDYQYASINANFSLKF